MDVIGFKEAKCKNCYKCVRVCNVKAIAVKDEQAQIISDRCILCGQCLEACPQNAKTFISDMDRVKDYIKRGIPTVVSIAPSYLGILRYKTPGQVFSALKSLGFSQARETAEGAVFVTAEYDRLIAEGKMENIITTCCPSMNDLIEIYYPELTKYMAPVVSPMIAHGKLIKQELGSHVKVVFLGPCIAKKREAENDRRTSGYVDAVINFSEFEEWLLEEDIDIMKCPDVLPDNKDPMVNRLYPVSSGIISSVLACAASEEDGHNRKDGYKKFYVDGIENCIDFLRNMERGEFSRCFVEANICTGGCVNGSAAENRGKSHFKAKIDMEAAIEKKWIEKEYKDRNGSLSFAREFSNRSEKTEMPDEADIRAILKKIGKVKKEDELNCSACGYSTCRDKAIAVYQGKAELTMCLPYINEKAQSMANVVLDTTPNIVIIVDADMKIVEFSNAAVRYFKKTKAQAREMFLFELIDHTDFEYVLKTKTSIRGKKVYYPELGITTLQSIVYIKEQNSVLGIFQDVSEDEEKLRQTQQLKFETIEMAQKVIDKQMMVAQEIAGLLGETTAETKVTLTKLRDMIINDGN